MIFSSSVFLLSFIPVTLLVYFLVPERFVKGRNAVLLIASLIFYGWGEPKYILIMIFSIIFNFLMGILIEAKKNSSDKRRQRSMLIVCVVGNLGILGFFKYTDFIIRTVNDIFGGGISLLNIALPIGISFYTFQTMSYVIDVYREKVKAQRDFVAFATYVSLFPQLIAGPIVRYSDVAERLVSRRTSSEQVAQGIRRFIMGMGKKVLLANQIYTIWLEASETENPSVALAWLGAIAFTFQIYFDFSGYSDMAIGLGKILGFDYLENFDYPYISKTITEFWRRWHISLSSWFKEYVYIPLGGNRKGIYRQLLNIAIVWALTGLWHGASWNFVLWGVYYGILLIVEKVWLLKVFNRIPSWVGHVYTMVLVTVGWVIFAIDDLGGVLTYIGAMFGSNAVLADDTFTYLITSRAWLIIICTIFSTPIIKNLCRRVENAMEDKQAFIGIMETLMFMGIFALSVAFLVSGSYNPFLYFRF